jgi:hypothetical protein
LRQALLDASAEDVIKFDTNVFPPDKPTTIYLTSELPRITQGKITIDASDAGVILDGTNLPSDTMGLVLSSSRNTIMGIQMINFRGIAIYIEGGYYNVIGGARAIGAGPIGRGNLVGHGYAGIDLLKGGGNIITGNLLENLWLGIIIEKDSTDLPVHNVIGPDNIIAHNIEGGIRIDSEMVTVTITGNSIFDNEGPGIVTKSNNTTTPPVIRYFDLASGIVNGSTCKDCAVEFYSTDTKDRMIFEGTVMADAFGNFSFNKGEALSGPYLTATTTPPVGNTSEFSKPTSAPTPKASAFYEPILAYLAEGHTTFQDDFSNTYKYYTGGVWDGPGGGSIWPENGYRLVQKNDPSREMTFPATGQFNATDFAIQFDAEFVSGNQLDGFGLYFRASSTLDANYKILFTSSTGGWQLTQNKGNITDLGSGTSVFNPYEVNTFLIIAKQENLAIFINGDLVVERNDLAFSGIYNLLVATAAETQRQLRLDNFQFWNLNGLDF